MERRRRCADLSPDEVLGAGRQRQARQARGARPHVDPSRFTRQLVMWSFMVLAWLAAASVFWTRGRWPPSRVYGERYRSAGAVSGRRVPAALWRWGGSCTIG